MKKLTLLFFISISVITIHAQPKSEIRAVWLTTNYALDWPQTDKNPTTQKKKLQTILDKLQTININTIFFQVQCRSDVFWESQYQPWSRHITGVAGKKPDYDVLQFVIDECHARNMEVHAWIVPYPLGSQAIADLIGTDHVSNKYPELCVFFRNEWYLDPGLPDVKDYLINLYTELVEKYNFDGINLDYTRYKEETNTEKFPDDDSFNKYGNGMERPDWRRQNINKFVHDLYDMIQEKKPGMKLGAAPIGAYESLPNAVSYFTARNHVFQDPVEWMSAGKLDLTAPQVYWTANYQPHLSNWINKSSNRPIIAGLAAYKMDTPANGGENWEVSAITGQITTARNIDAKGICFFRSEHITSNLKGLYNDLKTNQFKYPANIPPMNWYGVSKPNAPHNINIIHKEENTFTISWQEPEFEGNVPIKYYSIYSSVSENIDINDVKNLAAHYVKGTSVDYTLPDPSKTYYFTVTAFDKGYYESDPSQIVSASGTSSWEVLMASEVEFIQGNQEFIIQSDNIMRNVQIYTISGILISNEQYNSQHVNINTNTFNHGVYIVVVHLEDGGTVKHKMIK